MGQWGSSAGFGQFTWSWLGLLRSLCQRTSQPASSWSRMASLHVWCLRVSWLLAGVMDMAGMLSLSHPALWPVLIDVTEGGLQSENRGVWCISKPKLWTASHHITSSTFSWPKKVTRPAEMQEVGKQTPWCEGLKSHIAKGVSIERDGEMSCFCNYHTSLCTWACSFFTLRVVRTS